MMDIEGAPPYKRFRVQWEGDAVNVLGSFDTLDEAIAFAHGQRRDRRHYVHDRNQIVWPEGLNRNAADLCRGKREGQASD